MQSLHTRRRLPALLGVIAVLGNVLAGALCHITTSTQAAAAGPVDDALAICTAHGLQAPAPSGTQDTDRKADHCATCTLLAGFALIVALAFAAIAFPSTFIFFQLRPSGRTLADHLSLGGIRSRAPPAFA
jgi:hypothetical protein